MMRRMGSRPRGNDTLSSLAIVRAYELKVVPLQSAATTALAPGARARRTGNKAGLNFLSFAHYSHELEDYDRATEFEALGGKLIELPASEWKGLAEAA
ncbi:MAG: hypothetical protein A3G81_15130 [Betaproteobacteria bacterium RIFCSPLOWO2_12_FULL_65_14]|nr:MAG: hypothetical protein A3G81_15130 [Betaproteobacteria bacterium RIFCSPLOWO2_12_FULL_65_14]